MMTFGIAAAITVSGLSVALLLGTYGYDIRRYNMHDARLKGILAQSPTVYQVTEGLKEKAPLLAVVEKDEVQAAATKWGDERRTEILEKAKLWPQLRIYAAGDMMYFIFFDDKNIMRDYVLVSV